MGRSWLIGYIICQPCSIHFSLKTLDKWRGVHSLSASPKRSSCHLYLADLFEGRLLHSSQDLGSKDTEMSKTIFVSKEFIVWLERRVGQQGRSGKMWTVATQYANYFWLNNRVCTWSWIPASSWWTVGFRESQTLWNCSTSPSVPCRAREVFLERHACF